MEGSREDTILPVIADFLDQGHADTIAAMFRQDPGLYALAGDLLRDERFMVRMGVSVLFEELVRTSPHDVHRAVPALVPLLDDQLPWVRGEAASVLGIVNTPEARGHLLRMKADPDPQVREVVHDLLEDL